MIEEITNSRKQLHRNIGVKHSDRKEATEGGCGVIGIACSEQIAGQHLLQSLIQMRNRGNGKGGGVAAVGLVADEFGVSQEVLEKDYLLSVAYLDPRIRAEVERNSITPTFSIDHLREHPTNPNHPKLNHLEINPPQVVEYFVRVRAEISQAFRQEHGLSHASQRQVEDEIVYQNTFRLNAAYYASTGETRAFVLSHGKNLLVLKMVGFGDDVVRYYKLEDIHAHIWIGHHRYPIKGRVWHPGGAHPFIGMNEALVHNGDFANYASVSEYLAQRNIYPHFLTDTEVSVQMFDLLYRLYNYPIEYVIEALAPTTERDFIQLPQSKQKIYKMLQASHIHGSPDGPWFFLIAQSAPGGLGNKSFNLIGITDTSMLRPQVFALQQAAADGPAIGLAASEKQGIDAALESLSSIDARFWSRADNYWNARGGSHTDGGAFIFSVNPKEHSGTLVCTDKFGCPVTVDTSNKPFNSQQTPSKPVKLTKLPELPVNMLYQWMINNLAHWDYNDLQSHLRALPEIDPTVAIDLLTLLIDRCYQTGSLRRSSLLSLYDETLNKVFTRLASSTSPVYRFLNPTHPIFPGIAPERISQITLIIDAIGYPIEGHRSLSRVLVEMYERGFRKFIIANTRGHRFIGSGFGPSTADVRIDVYGSAGDYLASGMDGIELNLHGSAQDQLGQIMKSGKLIIHGDVGQTFGYAAKGGEVYIRGNAAGRPLINAVGRPKVVINGTCLDYLAESFMAGDPLNGGGFIILNSIQVTDQGEIRELETPYPGGNLFSLASGGAIYIRDPYHKIGNDQLNGGEFAPFNPADWQAIRPYLEENELLFDIPINVLLDN